MGWVSIGRGRHPYLRKYLWQLWKFEGKNFRSICNCWRNLPCSKRFYLMLQVFKYKFTFSIEKQQFQTGEGKWQTN